MTYQQTEVVHSRPQELFPWGESFFIMS
ncbi:Uncharacterized protein BW664_03248 [Bacillus mycoides]|nr:Uncharacterized protein BW664_03248 [Bacillus mycoides]